MSRAAAPSRKTEVEKWMNVNGTYWGSRMKCHITARGRTHASRGLNTDWPSVRAGTDRDQTKEGARGESAARCTNCQVGSQSRGRSNCRRNETSTRTSRTGAALLQFIDQRQAESWGDAMATPALSDRYAPSSTVSQPSFAQPSELEQQPFASGWVSCAAKSPADSNPQCCVATSQKASKQAATSLSRTRLTATSERRASEMSTCEP